MGKLRQTALILGEGPTEFFYFKSLCDVSAHGVCPPVQSHSGLMVITMPRDGVPVVSVGSRLRVASGVVASVSGSFSQLPRSSSSIARHRHERALPTRV